MARDKFNWRFFDSIRCVNLYSRDDRYNQAQELFDQLGIEVDFYRTHKHPTSGDAGCFQSHFDCIRQSYNRGDETCLIFEDDIVESGHLTPQLLDEAIEFMKTDQEWELFYLGTHYEIVRGRFEKITPHILKGGNICTHAYVLHRRYMAKMIHFNYMNIHIDRIFSQCRKAYGIYPCFFYQGASASDLSTSAWDEWAVKPGWFRGVELYAYYVNLPLITLFIILIVIVLLLYIINPKHRFLWLIAVLFVLFFGLYLFSGSVRANSVQDLEKYYPSRKGRRKLRDYSNFY